MSKFQELINGDEPVLVDFFATWCAPCKMMTPVLEELSTKVKGMAKIIKVDVDKNPAAAMTYQIRGVPTIIIFRKGKQFWRQSGVVAEQVLMNQLQLASAG